MSNNRAPRLASLNRTNGVTPHRWLLLANPSLTSVITEAMGAGWINDLAQLENLEPLADEKTFRAAVIAAERQAKLRFIEWMGGSGIDPDTIFDTQIKRPQSGGGRSGQ